MACQCPDPAVVSKIFDQVDVDKSGKIDKNELTNLFKLIFREIGKSLDDKNMAVLVQDAMKELDKSGDGMVDKAEFMNFMKNH